MKLAIIGAGNMAKALLGGFIHQDNPFKTIMISAPDQAALKTCHTEFAVETTTDNKQCVENADVILFAIKPQVCASVFKEVYDVIDHNALLISIAAGITQTTMQAWLQRPLAVIRCMPNTPALIGLGATGMHANSNVKTSQKQLAEHLMQQVGIHVWVEKESDLDSITALSGSGPAYFFLLQEAMMKAAKHINLDEKIAKQLICQTALGAANMVAQSDLSIESLRKNVTSPGGTTAAALKVLQDEGFIKIVTDAIQAGCQRAKQLGDESHPIKNNVSSHR